MLINLEFYDTELDELDRLEDMLEYQDECNFFPVEAFCSECG